MSSGDCSVRRRPIWIFAIACFLLCFVRVAFAEPPSNACNLPQDLQRRIAGRYPGARVVELTDLSQDDKKFFHTDHGNACPGLAKVDFYGDGKPTLALVLVMKDGAKGKTQLVVAHQVGNEWKVNSLDTGGPSPNAPVVWSEPPGKYKDVYGNKTIMATRPVIVFCGYESWAILYAWTGKDVTKIWIMD
jgi:hypothetical protein